MKIMTIASGIILSTGIWFYFILKKDRVDKEPIFTVIKVGLLGGILSVFFSGILDVVILSLPGLADMTRPLPVYKGLFLSLFIRVPPAWTRGGQTRVRLRVGSMELPGVVRAYGEGPADTPFAVWAPIEFLEISARNASAARLTGAQRGAAISITPAVESARRSTPPEAAPFPAGSAIRRRRKP